MVKVFLCCKYYFSLNNNSISKILFKFAETVVMLYISLSLQEYSVRQNINNNICNENLYLQNSGR